MAITIILIIYYVLNLAGSSTVMSRHLGVTTSTPTIIQKSSINLPRLNTAFISKKKTNEPPKIAFRPSNYSNNIKN